MYTTRVHRVLHRGLARTGKFAAVLAVTGLVSAFAAGSAQASNPPPAGDCQWPAAAQPFLPWADSNSYFLAPGGSFEGDTSLWTLSGGASVVSGNEDSYVGSPTDASSLSLPAGSSATTASICVTADTPILRLFVLNAGSSSSMLHVTLNYTAKSGKPKSDEVAQLAGGAAWSLSPQVNFLDKLYPLLKKNGQTNVSFTFTSDSGGSFSIDDLYIDPMKSQYGCSWGTGSYE